MLLLALTTNRNAHRTFAILCSLYWLQLAQLYNSWPTDYWPGMTRSETDVWVPRCDAATCIWRIHHTRALIGQHSGCCWLLKDYAGSSSTNFELAVAHFDCLGSEYYLVRHGLMHERKLTLGSRPFPGSIHFWERENNERRKTVGACLHA